MLFLVYDVVYYTDGRVYSKELHSVRLSFDAAIIDADKRECAAIEVPGLGEVYVAHQPYYSQQMTDEDMEKSRQRMLAHLEFRGDINAKGKFYKREG